MDAPPSTEFVHFYPRTSPEADTWWSRYSNQLHGLTATARASVEADSLYILERGIFGAGDLNSESWPKNRARTGLVMGSVQSGKTASMLGVSALAMDRGVDIVVVLAGTRLSLWQQTYGRVVQQLDSGPNNAAKRARRVLCPAAAPGLSDENINLSTMYRLSPPLVRKRLSQKCPIIVVAMKQTNHLRALGESLRKNLFSAVEELQRPAHMLILDDEADDGSILDAVAETGQDPIYGNLKQIPRSIANLWDPPQGSPDNLFTTYISYTATPQANLLQEDHNPLAPRDFLVALRTPLDTGQMVDVANPGNLAAPRTATYPEPAGISSFYTGGEVFYRRGQAAGLCRKLTANSSDDLADAIRAFLVAGAIRLHRSQRLGPVTAANLTFETVEEAKGAIMEPHSMLYHPSANIRDHFQSAEEILMWAGVPDSESARTQLEEGHATLPGALVDDLHTDPDPWKAWLERYQFSATLIESEFNVLHPRSQPDWQTILDLLTYEVIPGTRVSVVNSDPHADDRPSYEPEFDEDSGCWKAARDLSTIYVSGNVMARGLTLEGMTTALFQRSSNTPMADTQMQMQRWFGYRGSYIELCRVFASGEQLALFNAYHEMDEAIRTTINERMVDHAPKPAVLQGLNFTATGKIANLRNYPLSPGGRPFVTLVNGGTSSDPNADHVADLFDSHSSSKVADGSRVLGQILDEPLTLSDAAEWLDGLHYHSYAPGDKSATAALWSEVETRASAEAPLAEPGLYRPPIRGSAGEPARRVCPYSIAAYLRLWAASLTRPIKGLFVTGEPGNLWSISNLRAKQATQPRFWVGIRFGDGPPVSAGPLGNLPFDILTTKKRVNTNGELSTTWGTNTPTAGLGQYRGDLYFDYYHRNLAPPATLVDSSWRPAGSDGQILIFVNFNKRSNNSAIALGLCLPAGGPEQFAATRVAASLP